jgi:Flp pilus assembly protein TadG
MRVLHCTRGTAAVEAAIFMPIFLLFTLGITDLGSGMFVRTRISAATQSGAIYAVVNSGAAATCETMTTSCLNAIKAVMNDATGMNDPAAPFCTGSVCSAAIGACADGSPKCITVSANYPYTPILPAAAYSWAQSMIISSTATIRIQ